MNAANIQPYSRAVVKLLKGIVEKDDVVWNDLLDYQSEIQDYISVMALSPRYSNIINCYHIFINSRIFRILRY